MAPRGDILGPLANKAPWGWLARWRPAPDDLLRDAAYRRLWASILISTLGGQVTLLALPLTAALLLHATPTQMGWLTAMETLPFALFSLPAGVWLDRVRKLPVYVAGELTIGLAVSSVPLAWWLGCLSMPWLYAAGFVIGTVYTTAGSAAQVVLTQVVPRERLVEAHAKNALASSGAEVVGPGLAGLLINLVGPAVALLVDATMVVWSAAVLRGVKVNEPPPTSHDAHFGRDLLAVLRFVRGQPLLVHMAVAAGTWQFCNNAAQVVQILHAARDLGLGERAIGLCFVGLGLGTITTSLWAHRIAVHIGAGPSMVLGFAVCGLGWVLPMVMPAGTWGVVAFASMLVLNGVGGVLVFVNFLALRQAVTPDAMLGRMTATMRWLTVLPAGPGALLGGWLGEHAGLPWALGAAGLGALLLAWRSPVIWGVRALPGTTP
jgi:MFS family permease